MKVIRCLRENDFRNIQHNTYQPNSVLVFYGFDNYSDDVNYIKKLSEFIKSEIPMLRDEDMHVIHITPKMSIRHANQTMLYVARDSSKVSARLFEDYTIL